MNEAFRRLLFLPEQASNFALDNDVLHYVVFSVAAVGSGVMFLLAVFFAVRYRARPGRRRGCPRRMPRTAEGLIIGGVTALFLAFWVVGYAMYLRMHQAPPDAMTVYVVAKQWMWTFAYPSGRSTMGVLTVPQGQPVRLVMTSRDVIHSFFVPAFRVKQDVLPGRYVSTWFTAVKQGRFPLFCAEYCGLSHSRMLGEVQVLSAEEYERWAADVPEAAGGNLAEQGRRVAAEKGCLACHTVDGQRHVGPTWAGLYGSRVRLQDGRDVQADDAYLTRSMMDPHAELVAGFPDVMPTYRGQLDAPESAALLEFIRSLSRAPPAPVMHLPLLQPQGRGEPTGPPGPKE